MGDQCIWFGDGNGGWIPHPQFPQHCVDESQQCLPPLFPSTFYGEECETLCGVGSG